MQPESFHVQVHHLIHYDFGVANHYEPSRNNHTIVVRVPLMHSISPS